MNHTIVLGVENYFSGLEFVELSHVLVVNIDFMGVKICRLDAVILIQWAFEFFEGCSAFASYLSSLEFVEHVDPFLIGLAVDFGKYLILEAGVVPG